MSEVPTLVDPSLYDPWAGKNIDAIQSNRLRATVAVIVNGQNVTSRIDPHLIMVRVLTGTQISEYQCEIELDDRDGRLSIPKVDSELRVYFGWKGEGSALAWIGKVHDTEHGFGRKQGGRRLWIHGYGATQMSPAKSPRNDGEGEGDEHPKVKFSTFFSRIAGSVKQDIAIHSKYANIERGWWQQAGESYYHLGMRLAEEMGALFRVKAGNQGQFTVQGQNIDGTPTPAIQAVWARNLIAWRVRPMAIKTQWGDFSTHSFDIGKGLWKNTEQKSSAKAPFNMGADSKYQASQPAPNEGEAQQGNQGNDDGVFQANGPGRIVINGEPDAQGNCFVSLAGARPGVDGIYWCPTVEHIYSRQGYVTWLDVQAMQVKEGVYQRFVEGGLKPAEAGPTQPPGLNNVPGGGIVGAEPF